MTFEIYKLEWILSRHTFGNTTGHTGMMPACRKPKAVYLCTVGGSVYKNNKVHGR